MAFLRYAKAQVIKPQLQTSQWDKVRVASGREKLNASLKKQAEDILGEAFTPDRYLLTHATIVCSVDAVPVAGVKTGSVEEGGQKILRKYADFRITPETDQFINNNLDSWSRGVIKRSYKTFIGAHNFVEHVQVEELSKGRVIDAVLRDIGDSLYVDILVATDRKHEQLVEDIISGKMDSMSMGCSVDFTICTKCGHVAADETEMCAHIKYEKGNTFFDEKGNKHRVAELCGHESAGETGGVTFIEASWVAVPAFKGAVARNILDVPEKWTEKTASFKSAFGGFDTDDDKSDDKPEAKKSILEQLEDSLTDALIERVRKKVEEEVKGGQVDEKLNPPISESTVQENDTIIKEGTQRYFQTLSAGIKIASSRKEALENVFLVNEHFGIEIPTGLYRLAFSMGDLSQYGNVDHFLKSASVKAGKPLNYVDSLCLVRLSKLISTRA